MNAISNYRDLEVWQKAMTLGKEVYGLTRHFPKEEMWGLTLQVRRSSVSIPSNIAEGNGRGSPQDYVRFLHIARGSLYETQTQIELAHQLGFLPSGPPASLLALSNEIERMLNTIISKLSGQ